MSAPFRFITGDDDFLVDRAGRDWFEEQAADITEPMNREIIDGRCGKVEDVEKVVNLAVGALQSLSLFGDRKAVWLRHADFMQDSVTGRAEGTQQALENLLEHLSGNDPANVIFLLTASPVDRRRKLFKTFQKTGKSTHIAGGSDSTDMLADLVRAELAKSPAAVRISAAALDMLASVVHGDARLIVEEARKLALYLGAEGGAITEKLVTEMVPPFGETEFFTAANAFYSLDLQQALAAVDQHFFTYKDARGLITNLQNTNRLVIQLRSLLDAGALKPSGRGLTAAQLNSAAARFPEAFPNAEKNAFNVFTQHPFRLSRLLPAAQRLKLRQLINFQLAFLEAFEAIIDRPDDQHGVMRELCVRCLG
ncbi:MAG: DNA polymerase III subunit delta [Verrucomicrobiota bacterium]